MSDVKEFCNWYHHALSALSQAEIFFPQITNTLVIQSVNYVIIMISWVFRKTNFCLGNKIFAVIKSQLITVWILYRNTLFQFLVHFPKNTLKINLKNQISGDKTKEFIKKFMCKNLINSGIWAFLRSCLSYILQSSFILDIWSLQQFWKIK